MSSTKRRNFSPEQKVAILRKHLLERQPVSDICDQYKINVNQFYRWQKEFFENGANAFKKEKKKNSLSGKIGSLEKTVADKNDVIIELVAENIRLKKQHGPV